MYLVKNTIDWFESYVSTYKNTEHYSEMYGIKIEHSKRVCKNAAMLGEAMSWESDREVWLAHSVGLLHDIARFLQYREFNTFLDSLSFDHGDKGEEILDKEFDWKNISEKDKSFVLAAVKYHNKRILPSGLCTETVKWCSLARDADKIDIFRMIQKRIENGTILNIFPKHEKVTGLSPNLVEEIEKEGLGSYKNARSLQDYRLIQLTWGVDLNFSVSVDILQKEDIFDKIIEDLKDYNIDYLIEKLMERILLK